jgi:hypothetical protein
MLPERRAGSALRDLQLAPHMIDARPPA